MTKNKGRLELTWVDKGKKHGIEPRILLEEPVKSCLSPHKMVGSIFDNKLIFGDNLLSLKSLEREYEGKIKCIYIDPPYNTGSAFSHYNDGIEHSLWLNMMEVRLSIFKSLLADEGSFWASIDDNECHYLKVVLDEIFGRKNFVANVIWQKKYAPSNDATWISDDHDHILVYAKNKEIWRPNLLPRTEEMDARYKNVDNDFRGPWKPGSLDVKTYSKNCDYTIITPSGRAVTPPAGSSWRFSPEKFEELKKDNRIWFGPQGTSVPSIKRFLSEVKQGSVCKTIWSYQEVGHNQEATQEQKNLFGKEAFSTPKPERLLHRIIHIATNPGDLVLDSFAGSGTTGAVAHKMGRRWIMVELGEHCHTHIIPRMKKVIDGEDKGGVTEAVGWQGGGGFRYYRLAPSLLEQDKWGQWVINKSYNGAMLAEALCKLEGFRYEPSTTVFWQQGRSSERDFLYATTQELGRDELRRLSEEVGPGRTLLVLCSAFQGSEEFENLTLKKIPKKVIEKCEWGKDDYSLKVENLPKAPSKPEVSEVQKEARRKKQEALEEAVQMGLFGSAKEEGE